MTVLVYRLCDSSGFNCASTGPTGDDYFSTEVNRIWAQAGVSVAFSFVSNINSTAFGYLNDSVVVGGFEDLAGAWGSPGVSSTTTLDMFLVRSIVGAYGEAFLGAGGLVIAMDKVMSYDGGKGRIDTIAHELGLNPGLVHTTVANQLLATGGRRTIPTTLGDIAPDGPGLDFLPADQIAGVRMSSLLEDIVVPEPGTAGWPGSPPP
jgi:hypothetical protein